MSQVERALSMRRHRRCYSETALGGGNCRVGNNSHRRSRSLDSNIDLVVLDPLLVPRHQKSPANDDHPRRKRARGRNMIRLEEASYWKTELRQVLRYIVGLQAENSALKESRAECGRQKAQLEAEKEKLQAQLWVSSQTNQQLEMQKSDILQDALAMLTQLEALHQEQLRKAQRERQQLEEGWSHQLEHHQLVVHAQTQDLERLRAERQALRQRIDELEQRTQEYAQSQQTWIVVRQQLIHQSQQNRNVIQQQRQQLLAQQQQLQLVLEQQQQPAVFSPAESVIDNDMPPLM